MCGGSPQISEVLGPLESGIKNACEPLSRDAGNELGHLP